MIGRYFLRCVRTISIAAAAMAWTTSFAQYSPFIPGPLTRDYPGTLAAPAGGLRWGIDTLTYTLSGSCSGNSVNMIVVVPASNYYYSPIPKVGLGVTNTFISVWGAYSSLGNPFYPDTAPCTNGRYAWQVPITPDWKVVTPGTYDFVAILDPAYPPFYATRLKTPALTVVVRTPVDPVTPEPDMWWSGADESGWGLSLGRNGDALFVAGYLYDYSGKPMWAVMENGTWDASHSAWTADVYIPRGTPFDHYDASKFDLQTPAGKATVQFTGPTTGTFQYLGGYKHAIQRYQFASGDPGPYHGYWFGGAAQNGWGLHVAQQGDTIFATWYTYGADGTPTWFFMPGATKISSTHYGGVLYRATGGSWPTMEHYDPSQTKVTSVGTLDLSFSSDTAGTMTAVVDGKIITNPIQRFGF